MKTPIEPSEILVGDLIRWEWDSVAIGGPHAGSKAIEFVAEDDHYDQRGSGHYFLLDRPTPAVELPIEPTLGWLTTCLPGNPALGEWYVLADDPTFVARDGSYRIADDVTAFTPATAVPTEALDLLRQHMQVRESPLSTGSFGFVDIFLDAVDKAGESA